MSELISYYKLEKKVFLNILNSKCICNNDKILVGVSGGSDSMMLIHFLYKFKSEFEKNGIYYTLGIAHVNHNIRKESEVEYKYVKEFANSLNIPFYYLSHDVLKNSKKIKMGTEEYSRKIRYEFFYDVLHKYNYNKIATAHNLDDNVETVLLNIIRGSGIKGLCGMEYSFNEIIRPLIEVDKTDTIKYCNDNSIKFFVDRTNLENDYNRNKIRNIIIPLIEKELNPNFKNSIKRLSGVAKLDEKFLSNYVDNIVNSSIIDTKDNYIIFNYENILKEYETIVMRSFRNIIFRLLNNLDGIELIHIKDIIKLCKNNIKNKEFSIGNKFKIVILKKNIAKIIINERIKNE